jgi:hypothetical protein
MVENVHVIVVWVVTFCSLVGGYQHFKGTYMWCVQKVSEICLQISSASVTLGVV